jgi:CPA2 family monovalent cation:H+ antiporter-2
MHHEAPLIATIAVSLTFAFAGGFLMLRLGLPPLVGYLLAGVAVGPFTPGFVADAKLAPELAEIGVILLMFGVGMHFSVRDLLAVRAIALPGAITQIGVATGLGTAAAWWWGWPLGAGLVFGLSLSVASTVVLLRELEAQEILESDEGRIAVGWLIVEDLATVLVLVMLPALAGVLGASEPETSANLWTTLGATLGKVALFVVLMLLLGARLFPRLLKAVEGAGARELFTLGVIALALGVAFGSAMLFGVSYALGAFFAGVVVNESDVGHHAARDLQPLQDAFAVLFFVAVGMLFDPGILVREPMRVLMVVGIVIVGKSAAAALIVLALRRPMRTALTVAAALAQIGEFSFILAAMGLTLGLLPMEARDLILASALLSIALNPAIFRVVRALWTEPGLKTGNYA